jgi:3-methyl-2-oxobutanoate hydroxymethyltransferase
MSSYGPGQKGKVSGREGKVTVPSLRKAKRARGEAPIVMVTAYDAPSARIADSAGVDVILVGDSLGMVVLGHEDTLSVTMDDMVHHTSAAARAHPRALLVADMPWLSYHLGEHDAVRNAAALVRAGAEAVKLEGGRLRVGVIEAIVAAEIPVMGHLGLTPQSVHQMGGFRVQARQLEAARSLVEDAKALASAGCFAIVLEGIPCEVASLVTESVEVPTIGIGAGAHCDGQVLVFHDVLGIESRVAPKFVRRYGELGAQAVEALSAFAKDVREGRFPNDEESYRLPSDIASALGAYPSSAATVPTDLQSPCDKVAFGEEKAPD